MPDQQMPKPPELTKEMRLKLIRATCIKQAMLEVFDKHRDEINKIAREKLKIMGITVTDAELDAAPL